MIIPFPVTTVIAQSGPGLPPPAPPAPAAKTSDPATIAKNAEGLLQQMQSGKVDRSTLDEKMNSSLSDDQLSQIKGQLGPLGKPVGFTSEGSQNQNGLTVYTYKVDFQGGSLTETYVVDADGKVAGVWFKPADATGSTSTTNTATKPGTNGTNGSTGSSGSTGTTPGTPP
jgi:hypothetical protein